MIPESIVMLYNEMYGGNLKDDKEFHKKDALFIERAIKLVKK
jgi:hypothetical protein